MDWNVDTFKTLTDGLFRKLLGLLLILGGGAFLWKAAFLENSKHLGEVVGFVMGTAITLVLNFYFGTSQGSSDKSEQIAKLTNGGSDETT